MWVLVGFGGGGGEVAGRGGEVDGDDCAAEGGGAARAPEPVSKSEVISNIPSASFFARNMPVTVEVIINSG